MLIASYALQVRNAFVYIRGEFDLPYRRLAGALEEAYDAGYFGERILGTDFACDLVDLSRRRLVRLRRGVRADHLDRRQARLPAQPAAAPHRARPLPEADRHQQRRDAVQHRLDHRATAARRSRRSATPRIPGTRLISISGHIERPGVYEIEIGYPFAKFIYEDCGGVLGGRALKAIIPGGISTKVLTGEEIEPLTLDNQSLAAAGSSMGSGGMIVIADGTCMVRLLQVLLRFYHHESCGQCTPCREGMGWLHRIIDRIVAGEGRPEDIERLYQISAWNDGTTICGMGDAAGYATSGILNKFRDEFEYFIEHKRSRFDGTWNASRSS